MEAADNYNGFLERLILSHAPRSAVIVDFGAGTGTFARRVAAAGRAVTCIEPDAGLRARLTAEGLPSHASIDSLAAESVGYIYSLNVLEHIANDEAALSALRSRLSTGGSLLIYVPAFPCLYSSMDRAVGHVRRYRLKGLVGLMRKAGLEPIEARYCDCLGFFATLAFKALGKDDGSINESALVLYDRLIFPLSRALDRIFGRFFGKNLFVLARRTDGTG